MIRTMTLLFSFVVVLCTMFVCLESWKIYHIDRLNLRDIGLLVFITTTTIIIIFWFSDPDVSLSSI